MRVSSSLPQAANDTTPNVTQAAPILSMNHIGNVADHPQSTFAIAEPIPAQMAQQEISWQRQSAFACLLGQQTGYYLNANDLVVEENPVRSASIGHGKLQCFDVRIVATGQRFEISTYPASAVIASGHEDRLPAIANCVNNARSRVGMVTLPCESGQGEENFITVSFNRQGLISCADWLARLNKQQDHCQSIEDILSNHMARVRGAREMLAGYDHFQKKIAIFGRPVGIEAHTYLSPEVIFLSDNQNVTEGDREVEFEPSSFFYRFLQQAEIKSVTKSSGMIFNGYLAPEVKSGRLATSKADNYSLGVIFQDIFRMSINCPQHDRTAFNPLIVQLLEGLSKSRLDINDAYRQLMPHYTLANMENEFLNTRVINPGEEILASETMTAMVQSQLNFLSALYHQLAATGDDAYRFLPDALIDFIATKGKSLAGMQRYFSFSQQNSGLSITQVAPSLTDRVQEMLENKQIERCGVLFLLSGVEASHLEDCTFTDCYFDNVIGKEKTLSTLQGSQIIQTLESMHNKPSRVWLHDFDMQRLSLMGTERRPIIWLAQSLGQTNARGNHWENVQLNLNQCGKETISGVDFSHSQFTGVVMSSHPANIRFGQRHYYPRREILQSNFSQVTAENLTWSGLAFHQGCNFSGFSVKNLIIKNTTLNDSHFGDYMKGQMTLAPEMFNRLQIRTCLEPGMSADGKADFLVFLASISDLNVKQDFAEQMSRLLLSGGGELLSKSALYALLNHFSQQDYQPAMDIQRCCEWAMERLYGELRHQPLYQRINAEEQQRIFTRYLPLLSANALLKYQVWINQHDNALLPAQLKAAFMAIPEINAVRRELMIILLGAENDDGQPLPIYLMPDKAKGFYLTPQHQDAALKNQTHIVIEPEPFDIKQQGGNISVNFIGKDARRINEIFALHAWLHNRDPFLAQPGFDPFNCTASLTRREAEWLANISDNFQRCVNKTGFWALKLTSMNDHLLLTKVLNPYFSEGGAENQHRTILLDDLLTILCYRMMDAHGWGGQEKAQQSYHQFSALSSDQQRAIAALSLAELFTRLSSAAYAGDEDNSPPILRKIARHFLTDVQRLWPELPYFFGKSYHQYSKAHYDEQQKKLVYEKTVKEIDTLQHWQETLCPEAGTLSGYADCTELLSSEMQVAMNQLAIINPIIWEMIRLF